MAALVKNCLRCLFKLAELGREVRSLYGTHWVAPIIKAYEGAATDGQNALVSQPGTNCRSQLLEFDRFRYVIISTGSNASLPISLHG
jgi:hypothetical protein